MALEDRCNDTDTKKENAATLDHSTSKIKPSVPKSHSVKLQLQVEHQRTQHLDAEEDTHGGHGGHGHHPKPNSIISACVSGLVNFLLMFGLCCAYGMIMFSAEYHLQHRALGVKLNLCTALIFGLLLAFKSKVAVAIGGPDLNPVVFLGMFVDVLSKEIAKHVGLEDDFPESGRRRLTGDSPLDLVRRLGGSSSSSDGVDFCIPGGKHESLHMEACKDYHEQLRATIIFATAVSSAVLGLIYFLLGRFKITRMVSYVPTAVQEAFLSCIGYKVFKYALSFCNFAPMQFAPAAAVGVTLYFLKARHIGNPAVVIPLMILLPLAFFYIIVAAAQLDIETMRTVGAKDNWMFPYLENPMFWELWTESYGKANQIDLKAWVKTLPDLAIMIIVCVIDCLLKISSTESKLPVAVDKNYEAQLYGLGNILTTLTGSSVGYMQLKFNVINYGILGNTTDRKGGVVYAFLIAVCFFGTIGVFNFLPRFFLGILLFFAGAGFVAENLWGSRKHLSLTEWCEILLIIAVFILSGQLVAAVAVGLIVTCVSLIVKYTKVSCIAGRPLRGGQIISTLEKRDPALLGQMSHIADSWFVVLRLKGFIFFASAQGMTRTAMDLINSRKHLPAYRQFRYIIFDCRLLDGMDASAGKSIRKFLSDAKNANVKLLWSSTDEEFTNDLLNKEMIDSAKHAFPTLDSAVVFVENAISYYLNNISGKWLEVDRMFKLQHNLARFAYNQDPWRSVLFKPAARSGCPWLYCNQIKLEKCSTILWSPGETDEGLLFVQSGRVALFTQIPEDKKGLWPNPVGIYGHGWFLNREFIVGRPTKYYAVAIENGEALSFSRQQWWKMFKECPTMGAEVWRAVDAQQALDVDRLQMRIDLQAVQREQDFSDHSVAKVSKVAQIAPEVDEDVDFTVPYDDDHRLYLPEEFKVMTESLEIAEAFGHYGVYQKDSQEPFSLPALPRTMLHNLRIAFNTYAEMIDGVLMLPSHQAMIALSYAGISKVALTCGSHKFFSEEDFIRLGHNAGMTRLPMSLSTKLLNDLRGHSTTNGWKSCLQAHQFALVMRTVFHNSFTCELVQELIDEIGTTLTDEEVFLGICSRLFQWYEQHWNLLLAISNVSCLTAEDDKGTFNKYDTNRDGVLDANEIQASMTTTLFTREALMKSLNTDETTASEMLWACDWVDFNAEGERRGERLHAHDVALCVLLLVAPPASVERPPKPLLDAAGEHPTPVLDAALETKNSCEKDAVDVSKVIVNFRNMNNGEFDHLEIDFGRLSSKKSNIPTQELFASESDESVAPPVVLSCRQRIHITLEDPGSSPLATVISLVMGIFILISILTMIIRPVMEWGREEEVTDTEKDVWFVFELVLTVIFSSEYLLRLLCANAMGTQTTFRFVISPLNVCDVVAIIPFYVELGFGEDPEELRLLRVVRLLRLTRIVQLARFASKSTLLPPIAMVLLVIWGIYMKSGLSDSK